LALTHVDDAATRPLQIRAPGLWEDGRADVRGLPALELGHYLMRGPDGELLVSHMFVDDIRAAERRGDLAHAAQLKKALRHFIEEHLAQPPIAPDR
jgi:hypothetical protein